ncbi:PLP-dependent aminotransferase family protein, partial [Staphylococcus aureus]
MYYVSDIQSLPIINVRDTHTIEDTPNTADTDYQYYFNLAEIDAEYFPLHLFRKYAKEVFEDDQLELLEKGDL